MDFNYFTKTIQQRGKRYFQDNKVFSITNHHNHYHALVLGKEPYSVNLTINDNTNIVQASCDCPYAKDGNRCKHEAALYYALEERLLENTKQYIDFKKIYQKISRDTYNDYSCHNRFMKEIKSYISKLVSLKKINQFDIVYFQNVINDLLSINYVKGYRHRLMTYIFESYQKLMKNTNMSLTIDWITQALLNNKNKEYQQYFEMIILNLSLENQDKLYQQLLIQGNYDESLFFRYIQFLKANHNNIIDKIKGLTKYKNNEQYIYYHFVDLIQNNQQKKAIQEYQKLKCSEKLRYQLQSLLYPDQRDAYYQYMKQYIQNGYNNVMEICQELKDYYVDDWNDYKFDFYQYVKKKLITFDYKRVIRDQQERDIMIDELLNYPDMYMFQAFKDYIDDQELAIFLNMACLLNEAENVKNSNAYMSFEYDLQQLFGKVHDSLAREEIASIFKEAYPKRKKLHEILNKLLDGGNSDEIKY